MADDLFLSVAELRALIDSSDDAIISKTLDGVITFWNRGAERIFGWTAAEAVGRHITLIIPEERHAEADEVLARIRAGRAGRPLRDHPRRAKRTPAEHLPHRLTDQG